MASGTTSTGGTSVTAKNPTGIDTSTVSTFSNSSNKSRPNHNKQTNSLDITNSFTTANGHAIQTQHHLLPKKGRETLNKRLVKSYTVDNNTTPKSSYKSLLVDKEETLSQNDSDIVKRFGIFSSSSPPSLNNKRSECENDNKKDNNINKNKNNPDRASTTANDIECASNYGFDESIHEYFMGDFDIENESKNADEETEIPKIVPNPNIGNVPKDDNVSTTSSLSKNSTSSSIFSPSGEKKTYNPYGPESALKKKLQQTKMVTSLETDTAYKLWIFSRKTSKHFLALFNKENSSNHKK